jgi:hypothetical protein
MDQPKIFLDHILANLAAEAEKTQETVSTASEVLLGPLSSDLASTPYDVVNEEAGQLKHITLRGRLFQTPLW